MQKYKFKVVNEKEKSFIIKSYSSFSLKYKKGTNVFTVPGTLGIMVFKTRKSAERWRKAFYRGSSKIKRVIPIGRGKTPELIAQGILTKDLKNFYDGNAGLTGKPPEGTICYPGVFVVD